MITNFLEGYPLRFIDMVEKDGYIWFSACNYNGLFRGSLAEGKVKYMGMFPEAGADEVLLHSVAAVYKNVLFFGPRLSKNVVAYDIEYGKFENYKVPGLEELASATGAIAVQHGRFLYIWNSVNTNIVRFDMETRKFDIVQQYRDECTKSCESVKGLWRSFCIVENDIFVSSIETGAILQINVLKNEKRLYMLDGVKAARAICFGRGHFWFVDEENQIIEWYPDKIMMRHKFDERIPVDKACFGICFDDIIYYVLVGVESDPILAFHLNDKHFEYIYQKNSGNKYEGNEGLISGSTMLKTMQNKVWLFSNMYSSLQYIENQKIKNCKLELFDNIDQFVYDKIAFHYGDKLYKQEDITINLEVYLKYILKHPKDICRKDFNHIYIGEHIYRKANANL